MRSRPEWGECSINKDGKTLYLHILQWPDSRIITVIDLIATASAWDLANGGKADFSQDGASLKIMIPANRKKNTTR